MGPPGILWVNSKIKDTKVISTENFIKWYEEVHFPDIVSSSGIKTALRYVSIDPSADRPYLAVYPLADLDFLQSPDFAAIPFTNEKYFPGPSHSSMEFIDFDVGIWTSVHTYEKKGLNKTGPAKLAMAAIMDPAPGTDDDFNAWYRDEHCALIAEFPNYVRTRRFKLVGKLGQPPLAEGAPSTYLALHEFDGESIPFDELPKTIETPWGQKVMGGATNINGAVYKYASGQGNVDAGGFF